jgi:hypothetical protein
MLGTQEESGRVTELTLYVDGTGFRACMRGVTARLRDVAGVQTVAANHRRSVTVLVGAMSPAVGQRVGIEG